jgi:gas vesicle protein
MTRDFDRFDEGHPARRRAGAGAGTLLLVAAIGVSIGLLAAPETGVKTRRRLRQRLATLGADLGEGLEGMQELSGRARDRMRDRLAAMRRREQELEEDLLGEEDQEEEEESGSGPLGTVLAIAAGAAATYFLASERAAPARTRVRETAETVRRKATDRWERFQQSRGNGFGRGETFSSETTGGIPTSDEPPLGS